MIRRAEQEAADGNRSARNTAERARRKLVKERDTEGLQRLLEVANRVENSGSLSYAIEQNLRALRRQLEEKRPLRRRTPWFIPLLGGTIGAVLGLLVTYWLLHGYGTDALVWLAAGLFFLFLGMPLGGIVAHLLWRRAAK